MSQIYSSKVCYMQVNTRENIASTETPALPLYRVCYNYAFENIGLDFALYCRDYFSSIKDMYKCYILFSHVALHEQYIWK